MGAPVLADSVDLFVRGIFHVRCTVWVGVTTLFGIRDRTRPIESLLQFVGKLVLAKVTTNQFDNNSYGIIIELTFPGDGSEMRNRRSG